MYGLATFISYRGSQDPVLREMELFDTLEKAIDRANALMEQYNEEYGEDYSEPATNSTLMAVAGSDDVIWRAYIKEISEGINR